jgi:hypothetical protein
MEERLFAEELASYLGTSPRRLKRFANLYRLVKASMSVRDWDGYDADDARAVLTLLALLTGAPNLAPDVIEDILSDRWTDTGPTTLAKQPTNTDHHEFARAAGLMKGISRGPVLKRWASAVARYSFRRVSVPHSS